MSHTTLRIDPLPPIPASLPGDPITGNTGGSSGGGQAGSSLQLSYYLYDHLGNTRMVFHTVLKVDEEDPTYVPEYLADYYPYGKILREWLNCTGERYLTTQHERDIETGYDYRGARFYDADLGRFLSVDPLAAEYAGWSGYNYVLGNPVIFIDPDGRDAIISIKSGANGANGTVTVTLVFYAKEGSLTSLDTERAVTSFQNTWGNGAAKYAGDGVYAGAAFKDIEIDGQKYNVSYNLVLKESNTPTTEAEGEGLNMLTMIEGSETTETSSYGGGNLNYRSRQDKGTTFGHELSHVMGIGHNEKMVDEKGTPSISSYEPGRGVITKDIINSVRGAVQLSKGNNNSIITLTTGRGFSNMNTLNLKNPHDRSQNIRSSQYEIIENEQ